MSVEIDLSIVLPCYNEEKNIPTLLSKLSEVVEGRPFEVLLVNNGSLDDSRKVFQTEWGHIKNKGQFRLITLPKNIGYGNGIMTGLNESKGRILCFSHADLQCDPANIVEAYQLYRKTETAPNALSKKFVVKGKRFDRRENEKLLSFNLDRIASAILSAPLADINGQPKMFSREFYEAKIKNRAPEDLSFDVYLMARAAKSGYEILTFPVFFAERKAGVSSWNTTSYSRFRMILRFLRTILKVKVAVTFQN